MAIYEVSTDKFGRALLDIINAHKKAHPEIDFKSLKLGIVLSNGARVDFDFGYCDRQAKEKADDGRLPSGV